MADESDRVIPATPRRREAARRQGGMPTAATLAWVATAATATLLLPAWGAATVAAATEFIRGTIGQAAARDPLDLGAAVVPVAMPTLAVVVASALAGLGVRFLLDGWSWQPARALPTFRRVDPFAGLARIFSRRTAAALVGGAAGLAVMVTAGWLAIRPLLGVAAPFHDGALVAAAAWRSAAWLFAAGAGVAACRWLAARRRFEARIRMTPEEFAEETRSVQSDPRVRLLREQRRRQPPVGAA